MKKMYVTRREKWKIFYGRNKKNKGEKEYGEDEKKQWTPLEYKTEQAEAKVAKQEKLLGEVHNYDLGSWNRSSFDNQRVD